MATNNITFPIKKSDGTSFYGLVLHNATFDSVVMSLGDKITGDVYYRDNTLAVTMSEYIEYKRNEDSEAVRFVLVNPPTVVREGIVSDNSELRGMTKYSFVFYHPMYAVSNFPFTDVAVSSDEQKYLSNSKTFNWIGNLFDMVAKLNKNLQGTQWIVGTNIEHYEQDGVTETSMWQKAAKIPDEPLSFDKTYVSEVLKTSYETWEIPFVVDQIASTDARYAQGKRFLILFGTPSNEILDDQGQPYIFRFGQGVGLKNNSRTPKNNKIVTRIIGYGSENNIPFGYPQIPWYGDQSWDYTINNDSTNPNSYPIYKGICGGQYIKLIKHPFTRKTLMPSVYRNTLFNKVSPYMPDGTLNQNFDPTIELVDYYDADNSYVNPVVEGAESVEIHQFENIKPEFTQHSIVGISAYDGIECISISEFNSFIQSKILASSNENEKSALQNVYDNMFGMVDSISNIGGSYTFLCEYGEETEYTNGVWQSVKYTSSGVSFTYNVYNGSQPPSVDVEWDDTMDDDGNYKQSYFKMTLPQLDFDLYACASITEEMKINMRSGACIGCTFPIYVDWDDYKRNFYKSDGTFDPVIHNPNLPEDDGHVRNGDKYPDTRDGQVTLIVQKDNETFGTLMPNTYQKPHSGDEFVILGISLPTTYVTNAEARLDDAAKEYMRENNVHYYEYPLKFDEHFLTTNTDILSQIRNNTIVRFQYGGELPMELYVKQITVKYSGVLPTYDITLTDDVEIVLNQVGQVTDDVSRMRVQVSELQKYYSENIIQAINEKLSKVVDDVCQGRITFQQGLDSIGGAIFHDELRSPDFTSGLYAGHGWRIDQLGNAEFESIRARSFLEVVELLVNRLQAQEGDTLFTDNDQIDKVEEKTYNGTTYYKLSLKEKWNEYVTSQKVDNIIKGIINTLAAKDGNVSDVTAQQSKESDGANKYYTSWMKVINPSSVNDTVATNQICVILYGDASVPAGKNFKPCELMTIARWGCDAEPDAQGLTPAQKADIEKRQRVFSISTTDGRIAKLRGVRTPILQPSNYGTTLGTIPDFIRQWSISSRLIANRDYLYAQGIIVGDFIKVDAAGEPITNYVDCGNWQDNTPYLHNEYNSTTLQWETSDVWHNGSYWRCKVTQPYNNVYYEPTDANGLYWEKLLTSGDSVSEQPIYRWDTSKPDTPTSTAIPPVGWRLTSNYTWYLGGISDNEKVVVRIPIVTTQSNATITLRATSYSEADYDFVLLGYLDDDALEEAQAEDISSDCREEIGTYGEYTSGNHNIVQQSYTISTAGEHFICIAYAKDSSTSENGDCAIVEVLAKNGVDINMQLWRCMGKVVNGVLDGIWSEPVLASGMDGEDGLDGESAPFYTREWYAWSNVVSTASATESPFESQEPYSGWSTSIPNQGSDAYLWKKIVTYTWNAITRTYIAGIPQYFRMSGTNGTSISVKGNVTYAYDSVSDFPSPQDTSAKAVAKTSNTIYTRTYYSQSYHWTANGNASDGDAYTVDSGSFGGKSLTNHLIMWSSEANEWIDLGQFKGESGVTYYTHIAWATSVTLSQSELPIPSGQTNRPNALAANISGFSITPLSGVSYAWMGYLIDTNSSDSQVKQNYTWQRNKGEKGDDASEVNPNILLRTIFDDGIDKVKEAWSSDWTVTSIDAATDTIVEGRKSLRINMANGQTGDCDLFQVIFGKLKASTWYTVSFNYFATHAWNTFLHSNVESYPAYYDASAGIIIDGVMQAMSGNNGTWQWPADWTGQRHTMTFKTASDLSGIWDNSQLLFRVPQGCQLALCMPKLEIGQVATAYMANEDDLKGEKGDQGDRGKVGRFFYFAGTFNPQDDDPTHVFVVNDAQAPYFEHTENEQKRYHVFNYETNGSYTMAQMWSISSQSWNNAPWEVMTNDFKYIITEALFAGFAKLGSFVVNYDFFLSQYGTLVYNNNGTIQTTTIDSTNYNTIIGGGVPYTHFKADDPDCSTNPTSGNYKFRPTLYFNAMTGKASFGGGNIVFNQDGSGQLAGGNIVWQANGNSEFTGTIHASLMYSNVLNVSGTYTIDLVNNPANMFTGNGTLTLPFAEDYIGLELQFFQPNPTTRTYVEPLILLSQTDEYVLKNIFNVISLQEPVTQYTVPKGRVVTLKAVHAFLNGYYCYCWMVIAGDDGGYTGDVQVGNKNLHFEDGILKEVS